MTFGYTVRSIEPRDFGFVMAKVDAGGRCLRWSFRQVNGRWVMSEPTEDQLGKREKIADENFTFYVYPWSKVINEKLMDDEAGARHRAGAAWQSARSEGRCLHPADLWRIERDRRRMR